jgi:hypothetical protein
VKSSLFNAVFYQVGWFACVLGAAGGWETLGASAAIFLALFHLALAEQPDREWPLMLAAASIGIAADTLHAGLGVLDFQGHEAGTLAPLWIIALWLQFGTALHFCMRWLSRRYALACVLGLVGGPMAFLGGERLGAATFGEPRVLSVVLLGLSWAIILPTLVAIADRLGGIGRYRIFSPVARLQAVKGAEAGRGGPLSAAISRR